MKYKLIIRPEAERDLAEIFAWYENRTKKQHTKQEHGKLETLLMNINKKFQPTKPPCFNFSSVGI